MRSMRLASLAVALVLSAADGRAGSDPAKLVRGKWTLDAALSAAKQEGYEGATPAQLASLERKIATAAPDAHFDFGERTFSFGWTGKPLYKGTYQAGFGSTAPGREVIGLTITAEGTDDGSTDILSIQMDGPDVMLLSFTDIPYTLALRRVR
jgi:hypothetical protein